MNIANLTLESWKIFSNFLLIVFFFYLISTLRKLIVWIFFHNETKEVIRQFVQKWNIEKKYCKTMKLHNDSSNCKNIIVSNRILIDKIIHSRKSKDQYWLSKICVTINTIRSTLQIWLNDYDTVYTHYFNESLF